MILGSCILKELHQPKIQEKWTAARNAEQRSAGVLISTLSTEAEAMTTQMAVYRESLILTQISQVRKGIRWMPRRQKPKKDGVSSEKSWGAASRQ